MTEAQLLELTRAIMRSSPELTMIHARSIAIAIGLHDITWQSPLACRI